MVLSFNTSNVEVHQMAIVAENTDLDSFNTSNVEVHPTGA